MLVVDDNSSVRKLICQLFTRESDFEVCGEADNGRDAILKAQEVAPDLIVTDLSMPLMNGLEETSTLKKLMPEVPVIIYSAHMDSFFEREALAAGASAAVPKSDVVAALIPTARPGETRRLISSLDQNQLRNSHRHQIREAGKGGNCPNRSRK